MEPFSLCVGGMVFFTLGMMLLVIVILLVTFTMNMAEILLKLFGENAITQYLVEQDEKRRRAGEKLTIAQKAMQRARADQTQFVLTDIGVLAYRDRKTSKMVRTQPVVTDTQYLRPFAEITAKQRTQAHVTMALLDSDGRAVFMDKNTYTLSLRPTPIVTKNWLPLQNLVHSGGSWSVVIEVDGVVMAIHRFGWVGLAENDITQRLMNDGELTAELHQAVKTGKFRKMSLDELLADQED